MLRIIMLVTPPFILILVRKALKFIAHHQPGPNYKSYENPKLINAVIEKTILARDDIENYQKINIDSFRIFVAFALGNCEIQSIVDVGGAAGYHYFSARTAFPRKQFKWVVVETRMLVQEAQKKNELNDLIFCDNIPEAFKTLSNEVDLVYSSRAFQYLEDPITSLKEITELKPRHIFLTGIAFSPDNEVHEITQISALKDNGPQVSRRKIRDEEIVYKLKLYPRSMFEDILKSGYRIELQIDEDQVVHTYKGKHIPYNGIWAVRKPDK
jgi:putative methyltransferase (TIGR04325 family)